MNREFHQRLQWIRLYEQVGDTGYVCRRYGISRPTMRKWCHRFQEPGEAGHVSLSTHPKSSPARKVAPSHELLILELRKTRNLGARRIHLPTMLFLKELSIPQKFASAQQTIQLKQPQNCHVSRTAQLNPATSALGV